MIRYLSLLPAVVAFAQPAPENAIRLENLDVAKVEAAKPPLGYPARARLSVAGQPLRIAGVTYAHGLGMHSGSRMEVDLKGQAEKFTALAGVDDAQLPLPQALPGSRVPAGLQKHPGTASFEVWVDGRQAAASGPMQRGKAAAPLTADLRGARKLVLIVTDAGRWPYNNPADWADASILLRPGATSRPAAIAVPPEPRPDIAAGDPPQPRLHGPAVVGASPGRPFQFLIPATGKGPLRYAAANLPAGLRLDAASGIIAGSLERAGRTVVELRVTGPAGQASRRLTIAAEKGKLALTPPMGWNSWNVWASGVDDRKIRDAADWMVKSGLAAHGFEYINIDDAWMGGRGPDGEIRPNAKFPDMKALADYVHSRGLKLGIYSSPGPQTCQRLEGSYRHEAQDAFAYARWGIDFLKYDLCSYRSLITDPENREEQIKPYRIMGEALAKSPRDLVFSLCQYGTAGVEEWGPTVGGHLWRTTGDIRDSWDSIERIGFSQNGREKWAGPGRWNDPDMLVLGVLGWGVELHPTRLTSNEQITHLTLWSLLTSPLLLGCDLAQLDPFTIALLTNDEVLEVNQDPLGQQAGRRAQDGLLEVWSKRMADGTVAAGLFNRGIEPARVTAKWSDLGVAGKQAVRDLWRHKDLGAFDEAFTATVPAHGAVLVKLSPSTSARARH